MGEGAIPFPGLLYFTLDLYLIMLSVKQGSIKHHFLSLWYDDLGLNSGLPSHWRTFYWLRQWTITIDVLKKLALLSLAHRLQGTSGCCHPIKYCLILVSPMVQETGVQSQVKSYQRLKKWYLMPPCLALSTIRWGWRVKWSYPGNGIVPSPTPWCSSYWKESLQGQLRLRSPTLLYLVGTGTFNMTLALSSKCTNNTDSFVFLLSFVPIIHHTQDGILCLQRANEVPLMV